jgi:UDP-N-acetylglucosamine 2-epimerase
VIKVMTILGTRPEVIKMSRVIAEFDRHTRHVLVHTGQNFDYELNQVFFEDLAIRRPDYFLEAVGSTSSQTIARVIEKADGVMRLEKPDAVLLYGDTNSCLSVIAAKRLQIPVFHMEAGNRCFDYRVPEEINRKILDHLSDINMVITEHARRYLLAEGLRPETVIKTGSHMPEVLDFYRDRIDQSNILDRLGLEANEFFLVSVHREENVDNHSKLASLLDSLNGIAETYNLPVIVSTHPRTKTRLSQALLDGLHPGIVFQKPFGFSDYIKLQTKALCVISDSGTITEEATLLDFSAVNLRETHERPEGMDAGSLVMSGLRRQQVLDAVRVLIAQSARECRFLKEVEDYKARQVSKKILRIVLSYTEYVNRTVWRKGE